MDREARILLLTAVFAVMAAALILLMLPHRRLREFVVRRRVDAPPERIWEAYNYDPDNPSSAAFNDVMTARRTVSTDPEIVETMIDASGRHGTHHVAVQVETLVKDRPCHAVSRCVSVDGRPFPFGTENRTELRLLEDGESVDATLTWRGETATLGQHQAMRRTLNRYMDSLKGFCETGQGSAIRQARWSPWKSLALSALAFGSFALLFGWAFALVLSVAIAIHEFGHWLAMRMTGQPKPRIMLVPFFGGVAIPNDPHISQFDDAIVSLMGPGISVVPCLALLAAAASVGFPEFSDIPVAGKSSGTVITLAPFLYVIASVFGLLNCLQLLPVLPLDGGHVLRSLLQSASSSRARPVLLGLAAIGIVSFILPEKYILVAILALGAMQAWHIGSGSRTARPMGRAGMAAISAAYILIFAIHAGALAYAMRVTGFEIL